MADEKKLIFKRDIEVENECDECCGTGYVEEEEDENGDVEENECSACDGSGCKTDDAVVDPSVNLKAAKEFLKDIIRSAGFTAGVADDDGYIVSVRIKEFGNLFSLQCVETFEEAGGDESENEIEVASFILYHDDWRNGVEEEYESFEQAVTLLPMHLNQHAGSIRKLTKGEAKRNKAA